MVVTENHNYVANFEPEMSVSDWNSDEIEIYPNPFNDFIILKVGNAIIEKVEIYDLSGRLIFNKQINKASEYTLETGNIFKGNYLMKVYTNKGVKTFKVIKK